MWKMSVFLRHPVLYYAPPRFFFFFFFFRSQVPGVTPSLVFVEDTPTLVLLQLIRYSAGRQSAPVSQSVMMVGPFNGQISLFA